MIFSQKCTILGLTFSTSSAVPLVMLLTNMRFAYLGLKLQLLAYLAYLGLKLQLLADNFNLFVTCHVSGHPPMKILQTGSFICNIIVKLNEHS